MSSMVLTWWSWIATTLALWSTYKLYRRISHHFALSHLPGPPAASYVWGSAYDLQSVPTGTRYNVWRKEYGPVYVFRDVLMEPVLIMGDPKGANHVLNSTSVYWRDKIGRYILNLTFGPSILSTETIAHAQKKRILSPAFTMQSVKKISSTLFDLADDLTSGWIDKLGPDDSVVLNVSEDTHRLSLNAISRTMFAYDLSDRSGIIPSLLDKFSDSDSSLGSDNTLTRMLPIVIETFPQLLRLPNPMQKLAKQLFSEIAKVAHDVWDAVERGDDIEGLDARALEVLVQANNKGTRIPREHAVAEIISLIFAGSETTANVIGELLYELAHQPLIQIKMRDELRSFEARNGAPPSYSDLMASTGNGLEYFNAVINEALRCKAVLMDISREAVDDDIIPLDYSLPGTKEKSLSVRKGQVIRVPIRDGLNIDPDIWGDDAEIFKPERWLAPGASERGCGPGGFLTFGDGAKACIGRIFAIAELKIAASSLIRNLSFHPAEDSHDIDFYHLSGGNVIKPKVRGREHEGVQLPLCIRRA